ncbi:Mdj1 protein [Saccharomycopsis crataegensis]|uniref:DnaJ homolog 1, mitochondrial n=1 Tax=Saccharomycopsis crataegensis TaxID=43959 RepID=A0AAV5QJE5_9ASCO|nr:Mdj1 protein [Saccharomycopsis crataegensis]
MIKPVLVRRFLATSSRVARYQSYKPHRLSPSSCRQFHSSSSQLKVTDPYKTLGVDKGASTSQIKKAYYKLAKKYHPDVNKEEGAEGKFHDVQDAYEILSDSDKKAQYDQFGSSTFDQNGNFNPHAGNPFAGFGGFGGGAGAGGAGGAQGGNPFGDFNFEDLFGAAFRGGNGRGGANGGRSYVTEYVGNNIEVAKTVSLKDAVFGKHLNVTYSALDNCGTCSGSGLKQGKEKSTCGTCHGTGQRVQYMQGGFQMASTCNKCGGTGTVISRDAACGTCHGEGVKQVNKSTEVDLPPGISDGVRVKISGEGDAPAVTKSANVRTYKGDLIIRIRIQQDPAFTVAGKDLIHKIKIPFTTAILGGTVEVPTVDGAVLRLKVPAGTNNNKVITVPSKGIPRSGDVNRRGDMQVHFDVSIPKAQNDTQVAILEALADSFGDSTATRTHPLKDIHVEDGPVHNEAPKHQSTFDKIKNFLTKK